MVQAKGLYVVEKVGSQKRKARKGRKEKEMVTNHTQTEAVHKILRSKLDEARMKMEALRKQQTDIDLQIEDHARIILSLERSVATLAVAIPQDGPVADGENYYRRDEPNYALATEADEAA